MYFETEDLGSVFSTAWRKGCDSLSSAAVMHLLSIQKDESYRKLVESIQKSLSSAVDGKNIILKDKPKGAKYWTEGIAWSKTLAPIFKKACTEDWQPYREGPEAMALFCVFGIIPDDDWEGVGTFFWYCLMKDEIFSQEIV